MNKKKIRFMIIFSIITFSCLIIYSSMNTSMKITKYSVSSEVISEITDGESVTYEYFQIEGKGSGKLIDKINNNLKKFSTEWIDTYGKWLNDFNPEVTHYDENYLSVKYQSGIKDSSGNVMWRVTIGIIIDMRTGERVYLDDFFNGDELIECLENYHTKINTKNINSIVEVTSMSEKEYLMNEGITNTKTVNSALLQKPAVYIINEQIVIDFGEIGEELIKLTY